VAAWAIATPLVGLAIALGDVGHAGIDWGLLTLAILVVIIIHGYLSHAVNDGIDWNSGTDRYTQGVLSGGSKVVHRGLFGLDELSEIGGIALVVSAALGVYVAAKVGPWVWPHLVIGIGAALAYSLPPLRLSYKPLVGEWLCAWPALAAASSCTYYVATGKMSREALLAGALHGLFCLGWLMEHHISDIPADLEAMPRKVTTVAYVALRWGNGASPLVPVLYFLLSIPLVMFLAYNNGIYPKEGLVSVAMALGAAVIAFGTNPNSIQDITRRENYLTVITFLHAAWLGLVLARVLP
jgi:1,4-dihydroxy-2-naphthoate octaprenyltransferase